MYAHIKCVTVVSLTLTLSNMLWLQCVTGSQCRCNISVLLACCLISLVERGNWWITAAVAHSYTVTVNKPHVTARWRNSWGEREKAIGRGGRKCTQKSWDERQRKKKAILFQKDVDTVVLVNFFSLFCRENNILVPWKIIYSRKVDVSQDQDIVLSTESPQPGKCSERKTGFLQNKCALLLLQMWSVCAGQTRTLHSVELHTAK